MWLIKFRNSFEDRYCRLQRSGLPNQWRNRIKKTRDSQRTRCESRLFFTPWGDAEAQIDEAKGYQDVGLVTSESPLAA